MELEKGLRILANLSANNNLCGGTEIHYVSETKKFYVHLPLHIKDGICLTDIVEHRDTISEAVNAYIEQLNGKTLIFNDHNDKYRKEVFVYNMGAV